MLLVAIIYLIFRKAVKQGPDTLVIQGLVLLPAATIGINFLPLKLVNWKKSLFFKLLDASPVPKWQFMLILIIFYTASSFLFVGVVLAWIWFVVAMVHNLSYANNTLEHVHAGWFILGILVTSLISISIGTFLAGILHQETTAQAYSFLIYLPLVFLSGVMFPPFLLDANAGFKDFTYILPLKYGVFINMVAWNNGSTAVAKPLVFEFPFGWMPPVFGMLYAGGIWVLIGLTFNFQSKGGK